MQINCVLTGEDKDKYTPLLSALLSNPLIHFVSKFKRKSGERSLYVVGSLVCDSVIVPACLKFQC